MSAQSIDQHFAVIFPIFFLAVALFWIATFSFVSGWFSLAKLYRTRDTFGGAQWSNESGRLRWRVAYHYVLTIGADPRGLYLANTPVLRFMHPPLLVPWSEIKTRKHKGWIFEYVTFTLGRELAIPLRISATLAAKLQESAGSNWPEDRGR